MFGLGVSTYCQIGFEPPIWISVLCFLCSIAIRNIIAIAFVSGFLLIHLYAFILDTPIIKTPVNICFSGLVSDVTKSSFYTKLTIEDLEMPGMDLKSYHKVIINMKSDRCSIIPGERVKLDGYLYAPPLPVLPYGSNPLRDAFFNGVIAYGITNCEPYVIQTVYGVKSIINKVRNEINARIASSLHEVSSGVAIALITGARQYLFSEVIQDFMLSGLSHILAISGLHISLVTMIATVGVRRILSFSSYLALRFDIKKISFIIGGVLSFLYLLISGMGAPSQRAFFMNLVVIVSLLMHRKNTTPRALAFAAMVILLINPYQLMSYSFQLSFAAVIGLISIENVRTRPIKGWQKIIAYFKDTLYSTIVVTMTTAPLSLMLFSQVSLSGLFANMAAIPLTVFIIMPCALISVLMMPVGLEYIPLLLMEVGIKALIKIASFFASIKILNITAMPPSNIVQSMFVLGALWFAIWEQKWRFWGCVVVAISIMQAILEEKPNILISKDNTGILVKDILYTAHPEPYWNFGVLKKDLIECPICEDGLCIVPSKDAIYKIPVNYKLPVRLKILYKDKEISIENQHIYDHYMIYTKSNTIVQGRSHNRIWERAM